MKKKPEYLDNLHENVRGIRIYRDDIEEITQKMSQYFKHAIITDSTYQYDSIDDLVKHRGINPTNIEIEGSLENRNETISIKFEGETASLFYFKHDIRVESKTTALWYTLRDLIKARKRWDYRVTNPWLWGSATFIAAYFDSGLLRAINVVQIPSWVHITVICLFLLWGISLAHRKLNFGLILRRKHERWFFQRNVDQIWLLIVGALLGIVGTLLIQLFTSKK